MPVTSLSVLFRDGRRYLSVALDEQPAGTMEIEHESHCAEIIGLLWPELSLEERWDVARGGGVFVGKSAPP